MRRLTALTIVVLLVLGSVGGCTPKSREDAWKEDIDYLVRTLERRHPNMYWKIDREVFSEAVAELKEDISELTDTEMYFRTRQLVALVRDSHTKVVADESLENPDAVLPIRMAWLEGGLYVVAAEGSASRAVGKRVLALGDTPVDTAVELANTLVSAENQYWPKRYSADLLINPHVLRFLKIMEGDDLTITVQDGQETVESFRLEIKPPWEVDDWVRLDQEAKTPLYIKYGYIYWYEYLPDEKVLYFQYNECSQRDRRRATGFASLSFTRVSREVLRILRERDVEKFIFDLRKNEGGNSSVAEDFIRHIIHMEHINQEGKLFVIIGNRTFSSAVWNAMHLKGTTHALFFGEPTGGRPDGYGLSPRLRLPNSGLSFTCSTTLFRLTKRYDVEELVGSDTMPPDFLIVPTVEDYAAGRDPVLEAIIDYPDLSGFISQGQ